jgi:hypothetical protein
LVLVTLPPELLLVNAGRCRGLRFGAACAADARYDAGLRDRPAMVLCLLLLLLLRRCRRLGWKSDDMLQ